MDPLTPEPWLAWQNAVKRADIDREIRSLYADLDQAVQDRRPVCNASGRCCKFEEYGHRLYVTGLEIAWFLVAIADDSNNRGTDVSLQQAASSPNCPYQINGLCSTHAIRPLGCRVFFCEQGTEAWQQDTTEYFLDRLKQLHTEHDLPYAYMEWRSGLAEASQALGDST
jgi:Fe-S-cluster containining protein